MPIILNGTGTISGLTAGGLPDGVITTDDLAAGAVTTAKITGGPAFGAYASGVTNTANNTFTKVQLVAEEFDTANCYDTVNSRFTPNVAGYYQINGQVASAGYSQLVSIFKNGSEFKRGAFITSVSNNVSALIYLNGSTDYIELYWYQVAGFTVNSSSGQAIVWFNGFLARPA